MNCTRVTELCNFCLARYIKLSNFLWLGFRHFLRNIVFLQFIFVLIFPSSFSLLLFRIIRLDFNFIYGTTNCKFSDFSFTFIYVIFLVKNYFVKSHHSVLKLCHLTFFFSDKKNFKSSLFFLNREITTSTSRLLSFDDFVFQRHESIGDLA